MISTSLLKILAIAAFAIAIVAGSISILTLPVNAQIGAPSAAFASTHIAATGTTTVKSTGGILHTISINTSGASSNVITVYDGAAATGTVIAVLNGTQIPGTLTYDVVFSTNLTVVSATGTAADFTVSAR